MFIQGETTLSIRRIDRIFYSIRHGELAGWLCRLCDTPEFSTAVVSRRRRSQVKYTFDSVIWLLLSKGNVEG